MLTLSWPHSTRAHSWPAGAKLAGLALAMLGLSQLADLPMLAAVLAGLVALAFAAGWRFGWAALRSLWPLWPFVLALGLFHGWTGDWQAGGRVLMRLVAAVLAANLVTMTTPLSQMMALFDRLFGALRHIGLAPRMLSMAMALCIRFVPVLLSRAEVLGDAWQARSRRIAGWRILGPLALSALDDAAQTGDALRARGGLTED